MLSLQAKQNNMEQDPANYTVDDVDIRILQELQKDSRQSVRELAAKVHRSPTPVFERMRRLEQSGVISAYTVRLNLENIGRNFTVFCKVKLRHINTEIHMAFADAVNNMSEVTECYNVSGDYDYMLKVQVSDMKSYRRFVTDKLGHLPMLDSVQSVFVMDTIKDTPPLL